MAFTFFKDRKTKKLFREYRKGLRYRIACDGDILSADALAKLDGLLAEAASVQKNDVARMREILKHTGNVPYEMQKLRGIRYHIRNFLDVITVAFAVAFGIRALFLQPFKIPTSSMQPTLFGIHYVSKSGLDKYGTPMAKKLLPLVSPRAKAVVQESGEIHQEYSEHTTLLLDTKSTFWIGDRAYTLPGSFQSHVLRYADIGKERFEKGDVLCDGWLSTGDHLFVERFSLHFRGVKRGDVGVFTTEGLSYAGRPLEGFYYIKRIAGVPGDTLKIINDVLHVRPKGETVFRPVYELTPEFRKVYSGKGGYQGHLALGNLEYGSEVVVPKGCFYALGDNTSNSLDSRYWGFIPRKNMIGHAWLVFWPPARRMGIADTRSPLDGKTILPDSMSWQ